MKIWTPSQQHSQVNSSTPLRKGVHSGLKTAVQEHGNLGCDIVNVPSSPQKKKKCPSRIKREKRRSKLRRQRKRAEKRTLSQPSSIDSNSELHKPVTPHLSNDKQELKDQNSCLEDSSQEPDMNSLDVPLTEQADITFVTHVTPVPSSSIRAPKLPSLHYAALHYVTYVRTPDSERQISDISSSKIDEPITSRLTSDVQSFHWDRRDAEW